MRPPPDPERDAAPGAGSQRSGNLIRRGDRIDTHSTPCVYACSPVADECPWTCSTITIDTAITELIVDLMAVSR